jgi:hypothetical protein
VQTTAPGVDRVVITSANPGPELCVTHVSAGVPVPAS